MFRRGKNRRTAGSVRRWWAAALVAAGLALGAAGDLRADGRLFGYTYEVTTMAPGTFEYEQWVTWKASKSTDSDFHRLDFRHEIEFGITDRWQGAFYVSDWRWENGDSVRDDGADWRNVAFETIYNLTNPVTDPIGLGLYGEVKLGDELFVLEAKLLVQKNIGQWVLAYNFVFEPEWEGEDYSEDKLELGNTFGVSYQLDPTLSVGAELVHGIEYADWSEWEDHVIYAGPNVNYRQDKWWITVTPMFQVTDIESEPDFQTRILFGIFF